MKPGTLACVLSVLCSLAPALAAQTKLSGPLARAWGRFGFLEVSPDGTRVAYAAEQELFGVPELFAAPVDGSAPAYKLGGPYAGGEVVRVLFSPDSSRVVYVVDGAGRLMSAPADGSAPPVLLAAIGCADCDDSDFAFAFTPDGAHVLYRDERYDHHPLLAVPVDGSAPAVELGGTAAWFLPPFPPASDGATVAFVDLEGSSLHLHARPIDASAPAVRLDAGVLQTSGVPLLAPDGSVVFRGDDEPQYDGQELFAVPLDGSAPPRLLSGPMASGGQVEEFALADGGARVVYRADALQDGRMELFVVPLDSSAPPRRLSHALAPGGEVLDFALSADGTRAVYRAMETGGIVQLWSARTDVRRGAVRLNDSLVPGRSVGAFALAEPAGGAGARVVYAAVGNVDGRLELYSVPLDGSLLPHVLASGAARVTRLGANVSPGPAPLGLWSVAADGEHVLFFTPGPEGTPELRSVPVPGGASLRLDEEPGPGGAGPREAASSSQGFALFVWTADYRTDEALVSVPLAGGPALRLNPPHARGPVQGRVWEYATTPDGETTIYLAEQEFAGRVDLYAVPSDGSRAPWRLHDASPWSANVLPSDSYAGEPLVAVRLVHGGTAVLYLADPEANGRHELFLAPLDAATPAVPLGSGEGVLRGIALDPGETQVVFLRADPAGTVALFRMPLDASAAPTLLSGTLVTRGNVESFVLAPDGARVVFRADAELDERYELWSVPLAGGARVRLNPALASARDVARYLVTSDSARVLFLADARVDERLELYASPIAGGAPALLLDPAAAGGHVLQFLATPDSARAVFVARSDAQKLWSVPLDGSALPVRLDGPQVPGGRVLDTAGALLVCAEAGRVLYVADQEVLYHYELWSAPLDGSAPAVRRSRPGGPGVSCYFRGDLALAPDGHHVLYFENSALGPVPRQLVRTTVAGALAPLLLSADDAAWNPLALAPSGLEALYIADPSTVESPQLFLTPTDASRPPRRIDLASSPCSGVTQPRFGPDGRRAFWLDEAEAVCGVDELWTLRLPQHLRAADGRP